MSIFWEYSRTSSNSYFSTTATATKASPQLPNLSTTASFISTLMKKSKMTVKCDQYSALMINRSNRISIVFHLYCCIKPEAASQIVYDTYSECCEPCSFCKSNILSQNIIQVFCIFYLFILTQLFREWLSEKLYATIPKGFLGVFDFTVFQKNFKQWYKRPRT